MNNQDGEKKKKKKKNTHAHVLLVQKFTNALLGATFVQFGPFEQVYNT